VPWREVAPYAAAVEMSGGGLFPVERRAMMQQQQHSQAFGAGNMMIQQMSAAERRSSLVPVERRAMIQQMSAAERRSRPVPVERRSMLHTTGCGGTLTAASGSFTDGSAAAAMYPNDVNCRWVIRPQVGPGIHRSSRHSTYFEPTFLQLNGIL